MKINFVNPDHVHVLIDLPTGFSIEKIAQLLKGSSSHWVNSSELLTEKFAWGRGYGAFSVSLSNVDVANAIPSPNKKSITGNARLQTNCGSSSIVTGFVGTTNKAVETAYDVQGA